MMPMDKLDMLTGQYRGERVRMMYNYWCASGYLI